MDKHNNDYEAPEIRIVGSVADITQAALVGSQYDQPIPAGPIPVPGVDPVFSL